MRCLPWLVALACGCSVLPPDPPVPGVWLVELGIPEQQIPLDALEIVDRDAWLSRRPRAVLGAGAASIAVPFSAHADPELVYLDGLFEDGDERIIASTHEPGSTSGLDHDLSWSVQIRSDDGELHHTWVAAALEGDPGCGGDRQPRSVSVFDADRAPIQWDGAELVIGGVRIAMVIPDHDCIGPDRDRPDRDGARPDQVSRSSNRSIVRP